MFVLFCCPMACQVSCLCYCAPHPDEFHLCVSPPSVYLSTCFSSLSLPDCLHPHVTSCHVFVFLMSVSRITACYLTIPCACCFGKTFACLTASPYCDRSLLIPGLNYLPVSESSLWLLHFSFFFIYVISPKTLCGARGKLRDHQSFNHFILWGWWMFIKMLNANPSDSCWDIYEPLWWTNQPKMLLLGPNHQCGEKYIQFLHQCQPPK